MKYIFDISVENVVSVFNSRLFIKTEVIMWGIFQVKSIKLNLNKNDDNRLELKINSKFCKSKLISRKIKKKLIIEYSYWKCINKIHAKF